MAKKDAAPHLRIRLDPDLMGLLEQARTESGRTLTGELSHRLRQSFQQESAVELAEATANAVLDKIIVKAARAGATLELRPKPGKGR